MSSPLALAGVTAIIKDLLRDGLIDHDLAPALGPVTVSALPPDRIKTGDVEDSRLNVFLYQVTPNQGWRNHGMPSTDPNGERLSNPPLAIDLHYFITAYGKVDLHAEALLGYAMELMHDTPVLKRDDIRTALNNPAPINIPKDAEGRTVGDLADQIERIKITPKYLSSDELSRLWTSMQARYRPTMAYQVSTVLIQRKRPTRMPLPVLTRGVQNRGVDVHPNLSEPVPARPLLNTLTVRPPTGNVNRPAAELGDALILTGAHLGGETLTASFNHRLFEAPKERLVLGGATEERVEVQLPASNDGDASTEWPAGLYSVSLKIERPGKPDAFTNALFFALAPRISAEPEVLGDASNPSVKIEFFPKVQAKQHVEFFVGGDPFSPSPINDATSTLTISLMGINPIEGAIPVALRVDGVESILVRDATLQPPQFEPQQTIVLPL